MSGVAADTAVRARVRAEAARAFVIEAGAGTGKTTLLLERLVSLVSRGLVPLREVAAITFTEKAAGELNMRLRADLVAAEAAAGGDAAARGHLHAAQRELEAAAVTTIHAFCIGILREHPFAAGLDPRFTVADAAASELLFEQALDRWFGGALAEPPAGLAAAIGAGITPGQCRTLAEALRARPDCPGDPARGNADPAAFVRVATDGLAALVSAVATGSAEDRAVATIRELEHAQANAATEPVGVRADRLAEDVCEVRDIARIGAKANWRRGDTTLDAVLRPGLIRLKDLSTAFAAARRADIIADLVRDLRGALAAYRVAKAQRAWLDFDDILLRTRDLLRDRPDVRAAVAARWPVILVDEVQDTDPLQADVLRLLLSVRRPGAAVAPLCLVGDPKQSLYRFRRADLGLYDALAASIVAAGGERVPLTATRRNRPRLATWINGVAKAAFAAGPGAPHQAPWVALDSVAAEPEGAGPPVLVLRAAAEAVPEGADARREWEAWRLAEAIRRGVEVERWPVRDGARTRPVGFGDIAVLFRTFGALETYEDVFRRAGLPFVTAGGRLFYRRLEVQALGMLAAAIDDPGDPVAVLATLRGPLVGCSDDDLLVHRLRSGGLDPLAPGEGPAHAPLAWIGEWHRTRHARPVADTLREALDRLRAWPVLRTLPGGAQRVANVEKVLESARAQEPSGLLTFRGFTRALRRFSEGRGPAETDSSVLAPDEAAIRLMTVHGAKGLEFKVVVLADCAGGKRADSLRVTPVRGRDAVEVSLKVGGPYGARWGTGGAEAAEADEARHADAEERRTFYVALTRARDRLVVPPISPSDTEGFAAFLNAAGESLLADAEVREVAPLGDGEIPDPTPPVRLDWTAAPDEGVLRARTEWRARLERLLPPAPPARPVETRTPAGERATAIGRAVHAVLERADLTDRSLPPAAAEAAAAAEGVPDAAAEVATLAEAGLALATTRRAAAARRVWREFPLLIADPDDPERIVERRPDLLFERPDGRLVLADWKTDATLTPEREQHYRAQLGAYAAALGALRRPVAEARLLLVRQGREVEIVLTPAVAGS